LRNIAGALVWREQSRVRQVNISSAPFSGLILPAHPTSGTEDDDTDEEEDEDEEEMAAPKRFAPPAQPLLHRFQRTRAPFVKPFRVRVIHASRRSATPA